MLFPAPDFVVEILSKGTARKDKGIKKEDYALHGVKEYWIIDPIKQTIEQYLLINLTDTEYFPPYIYIRLLKKSGEKKSGKKVAT
jgi:Uma2 family endonuclease